MKNTIYDFCGFIRLFLICFSVFNKFLNNSYLYILYKWTVGVTDRDIKVYILNFMISQTSVKNNP